jgi:ribosomal protein S27E
MRLDKMTPEQRSRFEAHCADQKARHKVSLPITCMACDKVILDLDGPAGGRAELALGVVVIPFFGSFCSQHCAVSFERDYGFLFKRNASGQVSYD